MYPLNGVTALVVGRCVVIPVALVNDSEHIILAVPVVTFDVERRKFQVHKVVGLNPNDPLAVEWLIKVNAATVEIWVGSPSLVT